MRHLPTLLLLAACGGGGATVEKDPGTTGEVPATDTESSTTPTTTTDTDTTSTTDSGTPVFTIPEDRYDPTHLTNVVVTLPEAKWEELSHESRLFSEVIAGDTCFDAPPENVFDWYEADVVIDGEPLGDVGVRKKGFIGSMSWSRPSLKVDSDRFVDGQEFSDGKEHFTFNNNNQDPSRLHSCLAYTVFREAGLAAPHCAMAAVEVNGEALGVFSNVEPIKKEFLRNEFGSDAGELYEGTVSDFAAGHTATFEVKLEGDLAPIDELVAALTVDDSVLLAELAPLIDLEGFYTFWAAESLLAHWDGYNQGRNNYYIYHDPADGLLKLIPWGADSVMEDSNWDAFFLEGALTQRLWNHPDSQAAMLAEMQRLLDDVWDEAWLHDEIDRMEALIAPHLLDPVYGPQAIDGVREFVDERRAIVEAGLLAPPDRPFTGVPPLECLPITGHVVATFDTEWGTPEEEIFNHDGSVEGENYGISFPNTLVGSLAGLDDDGSLIVATVATTFTFERLHQVALVLPEQLAAGTYPVDIAAVTGVYINASSSDPYDVEISLLAGEVTFDEIGYNLGDPVIGTIDADIFPDIFGLDE